MSLQACNNQPQHQKPATMKKNLFNRRRFLKETATTATGMAILSSLPQTGFAQVHAEPRIKFSVININHSHIYGMVDAVTPVSYTHLTLPTIYSV